LNVVGFISPRGGVRWSSSSSEIRLICSGVGLLAGTCLGGGRKIVPAGASREPSLRGGAGDRKGEEAGTSTTLGEDDRSCVSLYSPGRLSNWVGCVVADCVEPPTPRNGGRKATGEQGIVASSRSSLVSRNGDERLGDFEAMFARRRGIGEESRGGMMQEDCRVRAELPDLFYRRV